MITVPSLHRFPYGELASTGVVHDALTHPLLRSERQMPLDQLQHGTQPGISLQTR